MMPLSARAKITSRGSSRRWDRPCAQCIPEANWLTCDRALSLSAGVCVRAQLIVAIQAAGAFQQRLQEVKKDMAKREATQKWWDIAHRHTAAHTHPLSSATGFACATQRKRRPARSSGSTGGSWRR
jgi:hypothetical protein